jgi:hypothetical protein
MSVGYMLRLLELSWTQFVIWLPGLIPGEEKVQLPCVLGSFTSFYRRPETCKDPYELRCLLFNISTTRSSSTKSELAAR